MLWLWVLIVFVFATLAIYLVNLKVPLSKFHAVQIALSTIVSDTLRERVLRPLKKTWYGYIVIMIWFMCGFLLSAAYSSNLLASLLVLEMKQPDNTFEVLMTRTFWYLMNLYRLSYTGYLPAMNNEYDFLGPG